MASDSTAKSTSGASRGPWPTPSTRGAGGVGHVGDALAVHHRVVAHQVAGHVAQLGAQAGQVRLDAADQFGAMGRRLACG
jgi:hypothetical protein